MLTKIGTNKNHEIIAAQILSDAIYPDKAFVVKDDGGKKLPDMYTEDLSLGIEIVQLERDIDLDMKYVHKKWIEERGDHKKLLNFCKKEYPGRYSLQEKDGVTVSIALLEEDAHAVDCMFENYQRNIRKKLVNLEKGNYAGINGKMCLAVCVWQRLTSLYDAKLVLYVYMKQNRAIDYEDVYVITSEKVFALYPKRVISIEPIISEGCIYDFKMQGENCIEIFEYIWDITLQKAKLNFPQQDSKP